MAEIISFLSNATVLTILILYVFAIWVGLVIWTWVDISRRTDNYPYRFAMILLVAFGAFVGFAFYLMIRPTLTKKEVEAQRLEEQFLLVTSNFNSCPNCGQVSPSEFLFCVSCATQLRDKCANCGGFMSLNWLACPSCGAKKAEKLLVSAPVEVLGEAQTVAVIEARARRRFPGFSVNFSSVLSSLANLVPAAPVSTNGDSRKANGKKSTTKVKKNKSVSKKARTASK